MEKNKQQKQNDQKLLSIMQFIHYYDPQVSLCRLFNGTSFHKLISCIPASQFDFDIRINPAATKWSDQLQNLQMILLKMEEYFQEVHEKCLRTDDIDLIHLTKCQDEGELIKYFQVVMAMLMESSHKEYFVESIMMLQQSSQQIFVQIIKQSLQTHKFTKTKYKSNLFQKLLTEFNVQKQSMQKQIQRLCKANEELLVRLRQSQQTLNQIELNESSRKNSLNASFQDGKNTKYLEEYIDRLQLRIVDQEKHFQEEKMHHVQRIQDLQIKVGKLEEAEELCKIYKEKYDQIMDQMQKMNIWKREKAKMQKQMEQKDFMMQKLNDRIEELTEKNLALQQAELQFKLDLQKKQLKIQKMSHQLKKVMQNIGNASLSFSCKINQATTLDQSLKQCTQKIPQESALISEDEMWQLKKQNEKHLKKTKQLQKQICKLTKRVQKLRMLEEDKAKLEQLVFQLRVVQSEELNLMFGMFYDGFEQNLDMSKKMRQEVLQFKDEVGDIVRKSRNSRSKASSILSKGKENWKQLRVEQPSQK